MAPLRIRSQALHRAVASAPCDAMLGFGRLHDITVTESSMGEGSRTAWRQSDLTRAIGAAEKACLRGYRIEIAPDGTIAIVVGATETAAGSRDCGGALPADR